MRRELARRSSVSHGQNQQIIQENVASGMEALKALAQSAPLPSSAMKDQGSSVNIRATISSKPSASPRASTSFSASSNADRKRSISPGSQMLNVNPGSSFRVAQPNARISFTNERRPTSMPSPSSNSMNNLRGSLRVKEKSSIYISDDATAEAIGNAVAGISKLAVDDPRVVEEINGLKTQVAALTKERDWLAKERTLWLSRIESDNARLAIMLRNVRDAKKRLIDEMDSVQAEKAKLKSMQMQLLNNELKKTSYPLGEEDCVIGPARRELMTSQTRKDGAQQLHDKLFTLVSRTHANYAEINELVRSKVDEAIKSFLDFRPEVSESIVQQLENIANAAPGNLKDAEAVAASVSEAMVGALVGKSASVLKMRSENSGFNNAEKSAMDLESKDLESKSLLVQNETLKASLAQMRKKYSQLLEKATNKAKQAESSMLDDKKQKSTSGKGNRTGETSDTSSFVPSGGAIQPVNPFDTLPFEIKQMANALLSQTIKNSIKNHPLSESLKTYLVKEAVAELGVLLQPYLGLALHACKEKNVISFDGNTKDSDLEQAIKNSLITPMLSKQITVQVHMILAYLFQRQKTQDPSAGKITENSSSGTPVNKDSDAVLEEKDIDEDSNADVRFVESKPGASAQVARKAALVKPLSEASAVRKASIKPPQPPVADDDLAASNNKKNSSSANKKAQTSNVFIAATGEEEVMTLRPPEKTVEKKNIPAFMQAVPKKKR